MLHTSEVYFAMSRVDERKAADPDGVPGRVISL